MTEVSNIQKLNEMIESEEEEICRAHQGDERLRQDHHLLHEQLSEQDRDLREAHEKSLSEMTELKLFQGSTFDTIARRKLVEDRDSILELTGNPEAVTQVAECLDGPSRITSKELAPIHFVKSGILQNACSTCPRSGCRFGEKCSHAHRQVDEQLCERSKKNDD